MSAADALNAAASAAANAVYEYAHQFERREDYLPLERLAQEVQYAAVEAGAKVLVDEEPEAPEA
jgi:hypothetical protein